LPSLYKFVTSCYIVEYKMHSRCFGLKGLITMKVRIFVRTINGFIFKHLNKYVRGNCLKQFYDLKDYTYKNKQSTIQEPNQIFQNQT
jgi:hypothetical protein